MQTQTMPGMEVSANVALMGKIIGDMPKFLRRTHEEVDPLAGFAEELEEQHAPNETPVEFDGLQYAAVYYQGIMLGSKASKMAFSVGGDATTFGWTGAFIIQPDTRKKLKMGERYKCTLFNPFGMKAHQVDSDSGEVLTAKVQTLTPTRARKLIRLIQDKWRAHCRMGMAGDFDIAALVLSRMKAEIPLERPSVRIDASTGEERQNGKDPGPSLTRALSEGTKRASVYDYFKGEGKSMLQAMADLGLDRGVILTHLHGLHKFHSIGYSVVGDLVVTLLPEGCEDPYAEVEADPLADDAPKKAPKATGKKASAETKPLPEKGKRREVALAFKSGKPVDLAKVAEQVKCSVASVKSHLHDLSTKHGLGFEYSKDRKQATIIAPKGYFK